MGMDTELQEVESFADRILRSYFCESDVEFLISTFAEDIVWMGAGERQKAEGKAAAAACFREGKGDLAPCDMTEERYVTEGWERIFSFAREPAGFSRRRNRFVFQDSSEDHIYL
ncbi:MAG: hypothetical protein ACLUOI_37950 [Eisenbergiella sp.]